MTDTGAPASVPTATARPVAYEVSCLPEDFIDADAFAIRVEHRGHDRWAVLRIGHCLNRDGEWEHELLPSSRTGDFLDRCRFDLDTALRLAKEAAPHVVVNGYTVADVLARDTRQHPTPKENP